MVEPSKIRTGYRHIAFIVPDIFIIHYENQTVKLLGDKQINRYLIKHNNANLVNKLVKKNILGGGFLFLSIVPSYIPLVFHYVRVIHTQFA